MSQEPAEEKYVSLGGDVKKLKPANRGAAVTLSGDSLDDKNLDIATSRGNVVVLNFWASWCPPCIAEAPNLVNAANDLKADGVDFYGVDVREGSKANGRSFERTHNVPFDSFFDPGSQITARIAKLAPNAIPTTLILDREGRIAVRFPRPVVYSELVRAVKSLLAESIPTMQVATPTPSETAAP